MRIRERALAWAFDMKTMIDSGLSIDPFGTAVVETEERRVEREGLLGTVWDGLFGKRIVEERRVRRDAGLTLEQVDLLALIEEEQNRYAKKQQQELEREQRRMNV